MLVPNTAPLLSWVRKHTINAYACQQSHHIRQNHYHSLLNKRLNALLAQAEKINTLSDGAHAGETTLPCLAHCASHHDLQEPGLNVTTEEQVL